MKFFFRIFLAIVVASAISTNSSGQDLLKRNDLSQLNVDQLSDADIVKLNQQLKSTGLTLDQAEQQAISRGMQPIEAAKLKQRLQNQLASQNRNNQGNFSDTSRRRNQGDSLMNDSSRYIKPLIDPRIFGSELFNNPSLNFNTQATIATPYNYVLGVNDVVNLSVNGVQETNQQLTVTKEGYVSIPNVGHVSVVGLTIEDATARIRDAMANSVYRSLKTGGSRVSLNLEEVRTIQVVVIGANRPGKLNISSLSTVYNALFLAQGPREVNTFREIQLFRNNKLLRKIDLYRFLVNGDQSDNITLKNNDVIVIPPYKKRVEVAGQVRRPGLFEVLPGETFANVLEFASGFSDTAYRASVTVTQFTERERRIRNIPSTEFNAYVPQGGDKYEVGKLLERFSNRLHIIGSVYRPGYYELRDGMRVADLISLADGPTEDAFTKRAQIVRLKGDLTKEIISFSVSGALQNNPADNVPLRREDEIIITSVLDLRDEYKVSIQGEVRQPGDYFYGDSMTMKDLIVLAGGFTEAAFPYRIEVARLLRKDSLTASDARGSDVYEISNGQDLSQGTQNIFLRPFDVVTVHKKPGVQEQEVVTLSGQIQYPGPYVLALRSEHVSSVLRRAGGFTPEANIEGVYLKRPLTEEEKRLKREQIARLQRSVRDSSNAALADVDKAYDQIPLNVEKLMAEPGGSEDMVLKTGDEIIVPKFNAAVRISGSVLLPTQIPYVEGYTVKDYISAGGGYAQDALKRRTYVLYANGKARSTRHFLFFKSYPRVRPGAEVVVPKKAPRTTSAAEIVGIASAIASLALVIVTVLNTTK